MTVALIFWEGKIVFSALDFSEITKDIICFLNGMLVRNWLMTRFSEGGDYAMY